MAQLPQKRIDEIAAQLRELRLQIPEGDVALQLWLILSDLYHENIWLRKQLQQELLRNKFDGSCLK